MRRLLRILTLISVVGCAPAQAARFPNAVEKTIVVSGKEASSVAELFGLNEAHPPSVSLQLGRMDAWAVYLLKKDTKVELVNDNDGSPARYDVLEFTTAPSPALSIHPFWLDLATQHPFPRAGDYSFSSPFISETLDQNDPWTQLVKRLKKESQWNGGARSEFRRAFSFLQGATLTIEVFSQEDYANDKKGHSVTITVHSKG
jgi:hypothetical protein